MKKIYISLLLIFVIFLSTSCHSQETYDELNIIYEKIDSKFVEETKKYFRQNSELSFILVDKNDVSKRTYEKYVAALNGLDFKRAILLFDKKYNKYYIAAKKINIVEDIQKTNIVKILLRDTEYNIKYRCNFMRYETEFFIVMSFPHFYELFDYYNTTSDFKVLYQDLNTPNTIICPEDNNITSIVVPDYICSIGDYSFANCEKLNEVVCGTSVDSIMLGAFKNCRNLQSVKLNSSLKNILSYAFYNCSSLEYIVIPSSVEYVGPYAFNHGTVYCDKEPRPEGWDSRCIGEMAKVYWKGEWEYNSEGIPQPIEKNSQIF